MVWPEIPRNREVAEAFAYSERRVLILALALPLLTSTFLFLNDNWQKGKIAAYFTEILRHDIIAGSIRDAAYQTQRIVESNGPFFRISYKDSHSNFSFLKEQQESKPLFSKQILMPVYYSEGAGSAEAGHIIYEYSLYPVLILSLAFVAVSAFSFGMYIVRQRSDFAKKLDQELQRQKNEAIARTINSLAHDLRTPLNVIEIFMEQFKGLSDADTRSARQGLLRIHAMIESIRYNEADQLVHPTITKLDMDYMVDAMKKKADQLGKHLTWIGSKDLTLYVDAMKIERVLQNLITNGLEAAKAEVQVEFVTSTDSFVLRVRDDGPGVPKDIEDRLFQRGMTFGKVGGTGLGLAYCRAIVEGHGGRLKYHRDASWTLFTAELPLHLHSGSARSENIRPAIQRSIGIFLIDSNRAESLKAALMTTLPHARITTLEKDIAYVDTVLVDNFDVMLEKTNGSQTVIFVKGMDTDDLLLKKLSQ